MKDAFFEYWTLSVVISITCVYPILLTIVTESGHSDTIDSIRGVMIRDIPVSAVCVSIHCAIEVNRTAQIVPLSTVVRVLEADHIVNLGA